MDQSYIIYSLDKNRTTQKFNRNRYDQILGDLHRFFSTYTNADVNVPQSIKLTAFTALDQSDPADQLDEIIRNTSQLWGSSKISPVGSQYPSGEPSKSQKHDWELPAGKFRLALDHLSHVPMPPSKLGPIQLFISYHFKLIDPVTKNELPGQKNSSNFCIWLSKSKSIAPTIFFPFENANQTFWDYVDEISNWLPFKLEEKYLRIAIPNKAGEIKTFRRIHR